MACSFRFTSQQTPPAMTESANSHSPSPSGPENTGRSGRPSNAGDPEGPPITPEEWRRLRVPFSRDAYVVESRATGRSTASLPLAAHAKGDPNDAPTNTSVVDLRLRPEAIRDRLDLVLSPGRYTYRYEPGPNAGGTFSMLCHLRVGRAERTGVGTGTSLQMAGQVALSDAASAFGMGAVGKIAGPVLAERESRFQLPESVLQALETQQKPAPHTPNGKAPGQWSDKHR